MCIRDRQSTAQHSKTMNRVLQSTARQLMNSVLHSTARQWTGYCTAHETVNEQRNARGQHRRTMNWAHYLDLDSTLLSWVTAAHQRERGWTARAPFDWSLWTRFCAWQILFFFICIVCRDAPNVARAHARTRAHTHTHTHTYRSKILLNKKRERKGITKSKHVF